MRETNRHMHGSNRTGGTRRRVTRVRDRRLTAFRRRLRYLRFGAIGLFLAAMVVAFVLMVALPPNSQGAGEVHHMTRSLPQVTHIHSTQPPDILSAVRASGMYQQVYSAGQSLMGQALRNGTLGTPVLVHAIHPTPGMKDVWVIPVMDTGGRVVALLDYAYDAASRSIQPLSFDGPFVPGDPNYNQPFPRTSQATAVVSLAVSLAARGASTPALGQPELVYFGADLDRIAGDHPTVQWTAGGQFPDLAVWAVPSGTQTYLVGLDGHTYNAAQLPLAPSAAR